MILIIWRMFSSFFMKILFYKYLNMHLVIKNRRLMIAGLTMAGVVDCICRYQEMYFLYMIFGYLIVGVLLTFLTCEGRAWEKVIHGCMEALVATIATGLVALAIRDYPQLYMQVEGASLSNDVQFSLCSLFVLICGLFYVALSYVNVPRQYMPMYLQMGMIFMMIMSVIAVDQITIAVIELECSSSDFLLKGAGAEIVIIMFMMFFIFDSVGRTSYHNTQLEVENKQYQMEMAHIDSIEQSVEALHTWKHDYQQHIRVVLQLIKEHNYDVLDIYCKELEEAQEECGQLVVTGNTAIDALLSDKLMIAKSHNIHTEYTVALPGRLPIEQVDLCIILGNILDNAIEACDKITDVNDRYIRINLTPKREMFLIDITNSSTGNYRWKNNVILSSKGGQGHGIGMKRIEYLVKRYKGMYEWEAKASSFAATIALPMNKEGR